MDKMKVLKMNIMEEQYPMFSEEELQYFLDKNNGDIRKTSYECLLIKAENTGIVVSGLTTKDSSGYFKMLASHYVTTNSGVLT